MINFFIAFILNKLSLQKNPNLKKIERFNKANYFLISIKLLFLLIKFELSAVEVVVVLNSST